MNTIHLGQHRTVDRMIAGKHFYVEAVNPNQVDIMMRDDGTRFLIYDVYVEESGKVHFQCNTSRPDRIDDASACLAEVIAYIQKRS